MKFKRFNDPLALVVIILIFGMWFAQKWLSTPSEIIGATIMGATLILQYFFRKRGGESS